MKKLFLMITLVSGFSIATYAQNGGKSPEERASHLTQALQKKLNLTADQANQVHAIMFEQASRMDSLKTNLSASDPKATRLSRRSIMLTSDQKLSSVLNSDQLKGYQEWKAMRKEKAQEKKNGAAPAAAVSPTNQG